MFRKKLLIPALLGLLSPILAVSILSADSDVPGSQTVVGDIDGDGWVSLADLLFVTGALGTSPVSDPIADLNDDGVVNILDVVLVAINLSSQPPVYDCDDIADVNPSIQVEIVENDLICVSTFINLLKVDPWNHLEAFYALVPSTVASDAVWDLVYDDLRLGYFRFEAEVVDDLMANLPDAVAACEGSFRCPDWDYWILPGLYTGGMYLCPDFVELDATAMAESIPYGDYYCTESTAVALAPLLDSPTLTEVLVVAASHENGWSRRNGVRILGRLAERPDGDPAHELVTDTHAAEVQATLTDRFENDRYQNVLHDVIWVLDSFFYPYFPMQPYLEAISADAEFYGDLRFRAMAAFARLVYAKQGVLPEQDFDFILGSLQSDDMWIRAEAAYICESLRDDQLDEAARTRVVDDLHAAWDIELELVAQVYIARALDRFDGTDLYDQLRSDFEATHLGNTVTGDGISVRSGLPVEELPAFVTLMEDEREAFFDVMGPPFDTPITGDQNDSMTLMLFATP